MIKAIDGQSCEQAFIRSGKDPEWLVDFLKKYPAAFRLSWVKNHMADLFSRNAYKDLQGLKPALKFSPGSGNTEDEPPLKQLYVDYLFFERITGLFLQGYKLTSEDGAFWQVAKTGIKVGGETFRLGFEQVKDRYYRAKRHKPACFIDQGRLIVGPTKIEATVNGTEIKAVGFWEYEPPPD